MNTPLPYKLRTPVQFGSETISEITIGRVTGKHMRKLSGDPSALTMGTLMDIASLVIGQPPAVLDDMDPTDVQEICAIVGERLAGGQ